MSVMQKLSRFFRKVDLKGALNEITECSIRLSSCGYDDERREIEDIIAKIKTKEEGGQNDAEVVRSDRQA